MSVNKSFEELAHDQAVEFARLLDALGLKHSDLSPVFGANGVYVFGNGQLEGKVCPSKIPAIRSRIAGRNPLPFQPKEHRCGVLIMTTDSDAFFPAEALLQRSEEDEFDRAA